MIPVASPVIGEEEVAAVSRVLLSGNLVQGPLVKEFEEKFAAFCGVGHAVAVNNGTAALHAALLAAGIGAGDEVIVPAFTFFATASSVSMCGARPVFADIDPGTFNLDPASVGERITGRTRAVIGVDLFGQPCDADALRDLCTDHHLTFVEDAAQAHGAEYRGRKAGSLGDYSCFSFYATKNICTGEGGMVMAHTPAQAAAVRLIANHGQEQKYLHTRIGYNYRMTDLAAAIGLAQLEKIQAFTRARRENAAYLTSHLDREGIVPPVMAPGSGHVYHQYVIRVTDGFPMDRDGLMQYLAGKGIGSAVHYPVPLHRQPVYTRDTTDCRCPVSEQAAREVLSLPVHPKVSPADLACICKAIQEPA